MASTIDFTKFSLVDALDLAIFVEDEAKERYEDLTAQMKGHHTEEAAEFFKFMVANESKHAEDLRTRRRQLYGDVPSKVSPNMVFEVEAPGFEEVRAFMTPREALAVALRAEEKAWAFFNEAIAALPAESEVARLFVELRAEEIEHQDLVRRQIGKLPPDSGQKVTDYEDEPVGL
jgi:rubrerythrin